MSGESPPSPRIGSCSRRERFVIKRCGRYAALCAPTKEDDDLVWAPQGRTMVLQPSSRLCLRAQQALQRRDMRFMTDVAADAIQQPIARVGHCGVGAQGDGATVKASLEHYLRLEHHLRQVSMRLCRATYLGHNGSLRLWMAAVLSYRDSMCSMEPAARVSGTGAL